MQRPNIGVVMTSRGYVRVAADGDLVDDAETVAEADAFNAEDCDTILQRFTALEYWEVHYIDAAGGDGFDCFNVWEATTDNDQGDNES